MSHVLPAMEARLAAAPSDVARRASLYLGAVLVAYLGLFFYLETTPGVLDRQGRVRGRDFLSFYVHGRILAEGGGPALYDAEHFRRTQESIVSITDTRPRYYPLYPPAAALLFVPFASLPYESALLLWWLLSAACLAAAGVWCYQIVQPDPAWKAALVIVLAAFGPVFSTLLNGHLSALLLLVVVCGLEAHRCGRSFLAGGVLSLLMLKPQLAVGPVLWLLCRRDVRTLAGFAVGALLQTGLTAACLGTEVFVAYVKNLGLYSELGRMENYTADHQHALAGVLRNWGGPDWADRSKMIHALVALIALGFLGKVVLSKPPAPGRREYPALVLFMLFATPHLLTYDLVLLLVPLAWLWAPVGGERPEARVRLGVALHLAASASPLYHVTGFSLVPLTLAWGLVQLALERSAAAGRATR